MKTMVCVPCMDSMQTEFVESLVKMRQSGLTVFEFHASSLIYDARNALAQKAVDEKADAVLWLDSDMVFSDDLQIDLKKDLDAGMDMVCGLFHMRRAPYRPCLYKTLRKGLTAAENAVEHFDDHPMDAPFEVEGCGFGAVMMRTDVIRKVIDRFHQAFAPLPGFGEDLAFCIRARACGYQIHCDPRIKVGHKAATIVTDQTFDAFRRAGDLG